MKLISKNKVFQQENYLKVKVKRFENIKIFSKSKSASCSVLKQPNVLMCGRVTQLKVAEVFKGLNVD